MLDPHGERVARTLEGILDQMKVENLQRLTHEAEGLIIEREMLRIMTVKTYGLMDLDPEVLSQAADRRAYQILTEMRAEAKVKQDKLGEQMNKRLANDAACREAEKDSHQ